MRAREYQQRCLRGNRRGQGSQGDVSASQNILGDKLFFKVTSAYWVTAVLKIEGEGGHADPFDAGKVCLNRFFWGQSCIIVVLHCLFRDARTAKRPSSSPVCAARRWENSSSLSLVHLSEETMFFSRTPHRTAVSRTKPGRSIINSPVCSFTNFLHSGRSLYRFS